MRVIVANIILSAIFFGCEKPEPIVVPEEETHVKIDDPYANKPVTIHKFVIQQMDFINYQDYDGTNGPDLYFLGDPDVTLTTSIVSNVTPNMLPLTIDCNLICQDVSDAETFRLLDYDAAPAWNDDKQDIMMYHEGFQSAGNYYYFVNVQCTDEKMDGTNNYIIVSDKGSSLVFLVYYTYN